MAKLDHIFDGMGAKKPEAHPRRETRWIHYSKLTDNAAQYCNEKDGEEIKVLADLIDADKGVLQNLLVRKTDADEYEIIAGHKRCRACRWLAEEEGKKQYEFLPCTVECISDVQAEFQLYSSNSHHEKTDYEKMHEIERMRELLEKHPEEFPHLKTGRMVERLAKQMGMKRTTVGEYLTIVKNLGDKGKEEFKNGSLKKSAAVELSALPKEEQEKLLGQGVTSQKEIKSYKENRGSGQPAAPAGPPAGKARQGSGHPAAVEPDAPEGDSVPEPGTQELQAGEEEYTPQYFLDEQKGRLNQMIRAQENGGMIPRIAMERQKMIVCALEAMVCGLGNG